MELKSACSLRSGEYAPARRPLSVCDFLAGTSEKDEARSGVATN